MNNSQMDYLRSFNGLCEVRNKFLIFCKIHLTWKRTDTDNFKRFLWSWKYGSKEALYVFVFNFSIISKVHCKL